MPPSSRIVRRTLLVLCLALSGGLSWWVRGTNDVRVWPTREALAQGELAGAFSTDPDGFYHARRVRRALSEGRIAARDPLLAAGSWPAPGAPIPWPPAYTWLASRWLAGRAGIEPASSDVRELERADLLIEEGLGRLPRAFGSATTVLAGVVAATLAPEVAPLAALFAGVGHALTFAHLRYSTLGSTDHHAFVSLLLLALLWIAGRGLASVASERSRAAAPVAWGALAGGLSALLLGVWVAGTLYLALVQLALGAFLLWAERPGRDPRARARVDRRLAAFGLALHASALVALAPAIRSSPWLELDPWQVVNLSYFHALELALGGLVFVPLLVLRSEGRARAAYPWLLAGACALGAGLWIARSADARAAFGWAAGAGSFMSTVRESQPLLGGASGGLLVTAKFLGWGVLLIPLAWARLVPACASGKRPELWPLLVAAPVLLVLALAQRRFGDPWAAPQAVLLALLLARGVRRLADARRARAAFACVSVLALALLVLGHGATVRESERRWRAGDAIESSERDFQRGLRELLRWVRGATPGPEEPGGGALLAQWDRGHAIEWIAARPSIATQFGSFVGEDSFLAPWRFFLESDAGRAEAELERLGARFVLVDARFPRNLDAMVNALHPEAREEWLGAEARWLAGVGAGLLADLGLQPPGLAPGRRAPDFLRLIHLSPGWQLTRDPWTGARVPVGAVFERVPGARLRARGQAGQVLDLRMRLHFAQAGRDLIWANRVTVAPDGYARARVPYSTEGELPAAEAAAEALFWTLAGRSGRMQVPEAAVREGRALSLE